MNTTNGERTTMTDALQQLPEHMDAATLQAWLSTDEDHRIIDVRSPAEYESVHIPGSYNIPLDQLGEHREELRRHVDEPVVLVCMSGQRATQAQQRLAEVGMPNVRVLEGGMKDWESAGGQVKRGQQKWDLERQVRFVAGLLVLAGIIGSLSVPGLKYLSGAVGAGLVFASLTNTCTMGMILSKLPYNRSTPSCDVDTIVAQLTGRQR
jgi:rhodanese-related sulfurtransferase